MKLRSAQMKWASPNEVALRANDGGTGAFQAPSGWELSAELTEGERVRMRFRIKMLEKRNKVP